MSQCAICQRHVSFNSPICASCREKYSYCKDSEWFKFLLADERSVRRAQWRASIKETSLDDIFETEDSD